MSLLGIHLVLLMGPTIPVPAPITITQSIKSVEVTNSDQGPDGFQIMFSVGRSGPSDILDYSLMGNPLLNPFNRVIIMVTIGAMPRVLIDGIITHKQFNPGNGPGQATLTITGEDVGLMMDMDEQRTTHPNQPDMLIVNKIILSYPEYGLQPVVIPPLAIDVPSILNRVPTQQTTDREYLVGLASAYGYVFYIEPTDVPGMNIAYWGPPDLLSIPQKSLTINMGADTNVNSINFQYDALAPVLITGSIQDSLTNSEIPIVIPGSFRPQISSEPAWLVNQPHVKKKKFQPEGGLNILQALTQAQAEVDKSTDVVTASGELNTLLYGDVLRARKLVQLRGAGYAHDGLYYVKSVTHSIKLGDYKQSFTLSREGLGSITPVVQP